MAERFAKPSSSNGSLEDRKGSLNVAKGSGRGRGNQVVIILIIFLVKL